MVKKQNKSKEQVSTSAFCSLTKYKICSTMSLQGVWDNYTNSCVCSKSYSENCAHYISNALILAGCREIDGGIGDDQRIVNGFCVCPCGRLIRAKELHGWFGRKFTCHSSPRDGINLVYQESSGGKGHVLLKICKGGKLMGFKGTTDHPDWPTQEYYY